MASQESPEAYQESPEASNHSMATLETSSRRPIIDAMKETIMCIDASVGFNIKKDDGRDIDLWLLERLLTHADWANGLLQMGHTVLFQTGHVDYHYSPEVITYMRCLTDLLVVLKNETKIVDNKINKMSNAVKKFYLTEH